MRRGGIWGFLGVAAAIGAGLPLAWHTLQPPPLEVPEPGLRLEDVTLVRPGIGRDPHRTLIAGETIEKIGRSPAVVGGENAGPYAGAFVLPGLVDLHVHHPPAWAPGERALFALLFLRHGVTAVRDTGNLFGSIDAHRRRIAEGRLAGPRTFGCGAFLDGDPPAWPGSLEVDDADSAQRAVARLARDGVDCVKVYNGISSEAYAAIREAADSTASSRPSRSGRLDDHSDSVQQTCNRAPRPIATA